MLNLLLIVQVDISTAKQSYALEKLNSLGFAVFIVGIMLMLLMVIHWYRMKARVDSKGGGQKRKGKRTYSSSDTISQLEYMTRDELKAMILREQAKKEGQPVEEFAPASQSVEASLIIGEIVNQAREQKKDPKKQEGELLLFDNIPMKKETTTKPETELEPEADAITKAEEVSPEEGKRPVRNPYADKVERTPLSTDLPDDFKKTSRKV